MRGSTAPVRALAICLLMAGTAAAQLADRVLAVVDGCVITLSDERAFVRLGLVGAAGAAEPTAGALTALINRQLMLGEVNRFSIPAPDERAIDRRLDELRGRFASAEAFEQALAETAMTAERLRDMVRDDLRIESYLNQRFGAAAQPTDDEVLLYLTRRRGEFTRGGVPIPDEEARELARDRLMAERRAALIEDWLDRLRRRAVIAQPLQPRR